MADSRPDKASAWPLVQQAAERRFSTRIGLEDVRILPDAALVCAALAIMRRRQRIGQFGSPVSI